MRLYRNIMEDLVEDQFDEIKDNLDCCTCEQCRSDIIAYALNQLPSKYVVSEIGELITKLHSLEVQKVTDVRRYLIEASGIVREHPRH